MDTSIYRTGTLPPDFTKAFKDADIRGEYGKEIDARVAYRTMAAFIMCCNVTRIVIGRDMRVSSPELHDACVAAARDMGATVLDIGMVTTPTMYYVSGTEQIHGVMVTASHNPAKYNGLKFVLPGAIPITKKTGLQVMLQLVKKNSFIYAPKRGGLKKKNTIPAYQKHILAAASLDKKVTSSIAIDIGNGMAGSVTSLLSTFKNLKTTELFAQPDGTFPNRESNPNQSKNQKHIKAALQSGGYDFGVAFDGDADRIAFFDEQGRHINAAVIGALLAKQFLALRPKSHYIYTVLTSRAYYEAILEAKGKPVRARVGHAFIKQQMRKHDAVFGCEHSAHFYFKDHFYADSGVLTLLQVLLAFSKREPGQTFSQMVAPFTRYYQTENKDVTVSNRDEAMVQILSWAEAQKDVTITHFDGVTISTPQWWCVVNQDVAMPTLNVMVESRSQKLAQSIQKEIITFLKEHSHAHS